VAQSVYALLSGPGGGLWVAGFPAALHWFDPATGTFTDRRAAVGGATPAGAVQTLLRARDGALWAGTSVGLERLSADGRGQRTGLAEGLPNTSVNGLLEDPAGGLWVATNRGLSRLDRATGGVRSYGGADGLQGEISYVGAFYAGPRSGLFYMGGERGYNAFDPLAMPADPPPAAPVLTGLRLAGEPVSVGTEGSPLPRALTETERLELRYSDRVVTLGFASLDFRAPSAHRYAVRLDGLDDDWREVGAQRQATFTNLSPGRYTFQARAAGRDGVWGAPSAPLTLVVVPPWWRSWAALLLYALLAAGGLGAVARVRRQRADLRQQMRVDQIEAEKLRELDRAKSQFFANVSHEFRTPLTLTMGPLDDVLAGEYGPLPDTVAAPLGLARRSAGRVLDLINQILEVSRLEAGRTPLRARRLDLAAFVAAHVEAFRPLAVHRTLAVEVDLPDAPVEVWADPDHAGTVLANLLSNAFKFTPAHGTVRITVGADADTAHVTVRDSGPGIEAADLPHIFDRFYQASRSGDRPLGSGIGLALAHNLAALHGGTLSVESEPGAGSAFTVTLPLGRAHLAADQLADEPWDATAPAAPPDHADLPVEVTDDTDDDVTTVLVADDHADIRAYLRRHLAAAGYRVLEAANGTEALAVVRSRLPDLVVSDVMMPGLDGLGLCRALRADPETDFVPVLLLTARAAAEDRLSGLAELCDDYLTKPFDARELVARVGNLIALRRRLRTRFGGDGAVREVAAPASPDAPMSSDDAFLATVRAAIEAHLGDDTFDVSALADAVGQSRSQLRRRTRAAAGVSPSDLIRTTRLDRAADLLAARAGTVSEVAYGVGFKSVAHFSNAFLAHTGARPSAYVEAGT
jgi:signal transduction histidine kinase/DNA-binding NarL/FixJ family response regulator